MKTFILFLLFVVLWTISYSFLTLVLSIVFDITWVESRTFAPSWIFLNIISLCISGQSVVDVHNSKIWKSIKS